MQDSNSNSEKSEGAREESSNFGKSCDYLSEGIISYFSLNDILIL